MFTSQGFRRRFAGLRFLAPRAERAALLMALVIPACAMSAEEGQTGGDEAMTASAELTPTIRFRVTNAGGTVAFSPDGARLATGSAGQEQAKILAVNNGGIAQTLRVEGAPDAASYSRDGAFIAIGTRANNQNLSLFRASTASSSFKNRRTTTAPPP